MRLLLTGAVLPLSTGLASAAVHANPLDIRLPDGTAVTSCADPTVIRGQTGGDGDWYLYCTSDPLHDADRDSSGNWVRRLIPTFRSVDLTRWTWTGDAFSVLPAWADPGASLWAPEVHFFDGTYFLYYAVTSARAAVSGEAFCGSDSAIGVATAASPTGPWTHASSPVVRPRRAGEGCDFHATIDPDVVVDAATGKRWIFYGSYYGGVEARELSSDGLTSNPLTTVAIAIPNRYEGVEVVRRDGWWWLFASATDCCRGPLTGYAVFVGRSAAPTGPYLDRAGASFLDARVGGTPVLSMNGNRWIGTGHNTVFADDSGRWWTIYHAVDPDDPYFADSVGFTKRPALLDALDWIDGWPRTRAGWWASECPQDLETYAPSPRPDDSIGVALPAYSDEFDLPSLDPAWTWVRAPAPSSWGFDSGALRWDTQSADLHEGNNTASVLTRAAPDEDFVVETRVHLDVPPSGCCRNFVQAGLVLYENDDAYVRLTHVSMWETRQTEFGKEWSGVPVGYPRYGNSVVGPPSDWTWLRLLRRRDGAGDRIAAWTSRDGVDWTRGGTWRHDLGSSLKIGLVSMGGSGHVARFDWVRTFALDPEPEHPEEGAPGETGGLRLEGGTSWTVSWDGDPRAKVHDVSRGLISGLPSGDYGSCFADDLAATSVEDADVPPPGDGYFYLVRGANPGCGGNGPWGSSSGGSPRVPAGAGACP